AGSDDSSTSPDDFVWPSQARRDGPGRGRGSAPARWGTGENTGLGRDGEPGTSAASTPRLSSSSTAIEGGGDRPSPGRAGGGWASVAGRGGWAWGWPADSTNSATGRAPSRRSGLEPGGSEWVSAGRGGVPLGSASDGGPSDAAPPSRGGAGSPGPTWRSG